MKKYNENDLRQEFIKQLALVDNIDNRLAAQWNVSRTYIGDLRKCKRSISGAAKYLGFERIEIKKVYFIKKKSEKLK